MTPEEKLEKASSLATNFKNWLEYEIDRRDDFDIDGMCALIGAEEAAQPLLDLLANKETNHDRV